MFNLMILIWISALVVFFMINEHLLITALFMEILAFILLVFWVLSSPVVMSEMFMLVFFSLFVIESVIVLLGVVRLVSFTGTDYLGNNFISKM